MLAYDDRACGPERPMPLRNLGTGHPSKVVAGERGTTALLARNRNRGKKSSRCDGAVSHTVKSPKNHEKDSNTIRCEREYSVLQSACPTSSKLNRRANEMPDLVAQPVSECNK
jgi:hypothetical protein